ncbi:MAG: hypothetical protein KGL39_03560 [Patescibacteria group bacterium]|nr:hypothetical protein [Patescibacteria group bacterium]
MMNVAIAVLLAGAWVLLILALVSVKGKVPGSGQAAPDDYDDGYGPQDYHLAVKAYGSQRKAAEALGISIGKLQRELRKRAK